MEIDLRDLRTIVLRLLDHVIETRGVDRIDVEHNFFWEVPTSSVYTTTQPPDQLDVGSISDNWEFLSMLLKDDALPVAYQLTELAPLLRAVGERLGAELASRGG